MESIITKAGPEWLFLKIVCAKLPPSAYSITQAPIP